MTVLPRRVQPEEIMRLVHEVLPNARVEATDTTGAGDHWRVIVVDAAFAGLAPIQRQRLVMQPFKPYLAQGTVHALDLATLTPEEAARAPAGSAGPPA